MDVRTSANSRKRKSADVTLDRVEIPQSNISAEVYPPYDMSLPENWSVQKLKSELRQLGISPASTEKMSFNSPISVGDIKFKNTKQCGYINRQDL